MDIWSKLKESSFSFSGSDSGDENPAIEKHQRPMRGRKKKLLNPMDDRKGELDKSGSNLKFEGSEDSFLKSQPQSLLAENKVLINDKPSLLQFLKPFNN